MSDNALMALRLLNTHFVIPSADPDLSLVSHPSLMSFLWNAIRVAISEHSLHIVDKTCLWLSAIHKQYKMDGEVTLKEDSAFTVGSHAATVCCHCIAFNSFVSLPCMFVSCTFVFASPLVTGVALLQHWFSIRGPDTLGALMHCYAASVS